MSNPIFVLIFALFIAIVIAFTISTFYLILLLITKVCHRPMIGYRPFGYTIASLVAIIWAMITWAYFVGRFEVEVEHTSFCDSELPSSFDNYTIVHISDLHLATFAKDSEALSQIVDSIHAQSPDLIVFTGDLVTISPNEVSSLASVLQKMKAKDGILSVLGNHDLMIYREQSEEKRLAQVAQLVRFEEDTLGWKVLRNQSFALTRPSVVSFEESTQDTLTIVGIDNCSCEEQGFRTTYQGDLSQAMSGAKGYKILLSHDPTFWKAEVQDKTDIAITLSGHTHAGQMRIGNFALSSLIFEESIGWYYHESTTSLRTQGLHVNSGLGCTLPIRFNCPAQISVIHLHKHDDKQFVK